MKFFSIKILLFILVSTCFSYDEFYSNGVTLKIPTPEDYCDIRNTKFGKFKSDYQLLLTDRGGPRFVTIFGKCKENDPYYKRPIQITVSQQRSDGSYNQIDYNNIMKDNLPHKEEFLSEDDIDNMMKDTKRFIDEKFDKKPYFVPSFASSYDAVAEKNGSFKSAKSDASFVV